MNIKTYLPLGMAAVLGVLALVVARMVMTPTHAGPPVGEAPVVIVTGDIDPGHPLTADDLSIRNMPIPTMPADAIHGTAEAAGRVPIVKLAKGQPVTQSALAPATAGSGLAALIPLGMRAMTIQVDDSSAMSGMIEPGSHVDVVANIRDDKLQQSACRTVLQNMKVTAVGRMTAAQPFNAPPGSPPPPTNSVTILCTPDEAQTLELACTQSHPWLVLRNGQDKRRLQIGTTAMADLAGQPGDGGMTLGGFFNRLAALQRTAATQPADATAAVITTSDTGVVHRTVSIIRGGAESKVTFTMPAPTPTPSTLVNTDTGELNAR